MPRCIVCGQEKLLILRDTQTCTACRPALKKGQALASLRELEDKERLEILALFCIVCGSEEKECWKRH